MFIHFTSHLLCIVTALTERSEATTISTITALVGKTSGILIHNPLAKLKNHLTTLLHTQILNQVN